MMSLKKTVLNFLIFFPVLVFSQESQNKERLHSITVSSDIFQVLNSAYRIDIERKKVDSHLSHFLTLEFLHGITNDKPYWWWGEENDDDDDVSGYGLGLHQKWVANKGNSRNSPYLAYGVGFRRVSIKYKDIGFTRSYQNDLEYFNYGPFEDKMKINSGTANLITGFQLTPPHNLIFDFYLGAGYKISNSKSGVPGFREYNKSPSAFAYKGAVFHFGIKMGFKVH